jgi:hypothetical protein
MNGEIEKNHSPPKKIRPMYTCCLRHFVPIVVVDNGAVIGFSYV